MLEYIYKKMNTVGALSHVSTYKYFHAFVHMASPQLGHKSVLITTLTTSKASGDALSEPFVLLSNPHLLDSLKSSLIYETIAS